MKLDVLDITGKKKGDIEVSDAIFDRAWNADLVHQVFVSLNANARRPWAHTKTRGEVRGGGKKPWRQKGTGRARHGSRRSPIWSGGGVTFGPRNERDFSKKINRKMKKAALYATISRKRVDGELRIVDGISLKDAKTRELQAALLGFYGEKEIPSTLIVSTPAHKDLARASQNLPSVKTVPADALSIIDLLNYKNIIIEEDAVASIS